MNARAAGSFPATGTVQAVQHVRRMRGGAQSHMMRCSDGHYYVVKFQNNPQHTRVLANELLATRLAEQVGLSVPRTAIVDVSPWLIEHTAELRVEAAGASDAFRAGLQFGARYVVDPFEGQVFDFVPETAFERVRNLREFLGMLCMDKWTCNANGRQAVFWRRMRERRYTVTFVDQGYCFNAGEWNFPDSPLRGVYARNDVYRGVRGWDDFEPWLSRIEEMAPEQVFAAGEGVPPEWYGEWEQLERLLAEVVRRRAKVRDLLMAFRHSTRAPFPRWAKSSLAVQ